MTADEASDAVAVIVVCFVLLAGFLLMIAWREEIEAAFELISDAVGRAATWPVRRYRAWKDRARRASIADAATLWTADPAALLLNDHNTAAAHVVAINERKTMQDNETTGAVTRSVEHAALSWAVGSLGSLSRPIVAGKSQEFGYTRPDRLEIRVMIPRTPFEAETEAQAYGVVSAGLTLDEAESFALGLLGAVATARVEQRTAGVTFGEPAL